MQPLKSVGPKFPNSDRGLEMGPVTFVKEGRDLVARAPFGNARDLEGRSRFANRGGLSTACNSCCYAVHPIICLRKFFSWTPVKRTCQRRKSKTKSDYASALSSVKLRKTKSISICIFDRAKLWSNNFLNQQISRLQSVRPLKMRLVLLG